MRVAMHNYSKTDRERWVSELAKSPNRTDFERDRARILHSAAFRRLGEKTQVLGPATDDFIRTRLTHSMEVAQVGRELARALGADPDVVDAACLAHDLGHPPFGHNGEKALNSIAGEVGGFEGNAQTFRLVTRLEPKVVAPDGSPRGLNLTRASLDAVCKYPWLRAQGPNPQYSQKKYSVYDDDRGAFEWMRNGASGRCLEAQIMDLSDDIAYSVHDIEDAVMTGKLPLGKLRDDNEFEQVANRTREWYDASLDDTMLQAARESLLSKPYWLSSFDGTYLDRAKLKDMTSQLIGSFCSQTVEATRAAARANVQEGLGRYDANLEVAPNTAVQITLLKGIAAHYVMAPREMEGSFHRQGGILVDLVEVLMETNGHHLAQPFASMWSETHDDKERLRIVIDQVASLTDLSAQRMHASLCGLFDARS